jgi:hypothetical protein
MGQSTADLMPGGSEPWTGGPASAPRMAFQLPDSRVTPLGTIFLCHTMPGFVGYQTECPVSAGRFLTLNVLHGSNTAGPQAGTPGPNVCSDAGTQETPRRVLGGSGMPSSSGHWFAADSPVEEAGFEPAVPHAMEPSTGIFEFRQFL